MITYNIEPHDITTLTAPMFDACGIECPAMIGAACPRKTIDARTRPAKLQHCPGWSAKFPNAAAEVVHGWTQRSLQDETCGGEDGNTWFALFRAPDGDIGTPMGAGVILCVLTSGAARLTRFDTVFELDQDWTELVAEHEHEHDVEETD